jgi:hypothetical protein
MKKSSFIFLTILTSLSLEVCSAQDLSPKNVTPIDTVIVDESDSVYYHQQPQPVAFNYYYRSRIWDSFYRICFPRRYYAVINRPGYIPRHVRPHHRDYAHHSGKTSHKRGGFGRSGARTVAA